jgi:transcriptional regulator with XRE-family HTH domain
MDEQGVTVATLAAQVECEPSSVRKYLAGTVRPSDRVLARLARCLETTPEELKYGRREDRIGQPTTDEVSRITGIDPLSLRIGLQRGVWPFGTAYKRPGSTHYTYVYDPTAVLKWAADRKAMTRGASDEKSEPVSGPFGGTVG